MDVIFEKYKKYLMDMSDNMKNSNVIPKKLKKIFKNMSKKVNKMDDKTFLFLFDSHLQYLLDTMLSSDNETLNLFMDMISTMHKYKNNPNDDDDETSEVPFHEEVNEIGEFIIESFGIPSKMPKTKLEALKDNEELITNSPNITIPDYLKDIQWAMISPMKLTIASNGTMWMNQELWQYLIDIIYFEAFSMAPILYNKPDPPSEVTVNIGYNKDKLLISLDKGVSRCLKIKFNKKTDKNGNIYATTDDDISFKFAIETSFNVKGEYIIKPTTLFGVLEGTKTNSMDMNIEFV